MRFATTSITPPLGLAYIAGALERAGETVHVIDAVGEDPTRRTRYLTGYLIGRSLSDIVDQIPASSAVVGVSVIFTHEWPLAVRLIALIKAARPDVQVVLGGEHVTAMPEFCLLTSDADILVLGEGEESIVETVAALRTGRPLDDVDGIAFRVDHGVAVNRRRRRARDVDAVAWPAWHHFRIDTYHRHGYVGGNRSAHMTVPILATRGCPYQCTYCSAPSMWTPTWIPRDPVRVVDEIEHYVRTYGARNFPFQDLTAIIQKDWIVRFCQELLARRLDIQWQLPSGTRSEAIDDEVADLLRRSGMVNMAYAPESGSETTRRLIKKKMQTDRLLRSVRAAVDADLNVSLFIVLGLPHDRADTVAESLPFLAEMKRLGVRDLSVSFYMALPGTELFDSLYDAGRITLDRTYFGHMLHNLSIVPVRSYSEHLNRAQLLYWKLRLFLRFYGTKRTGSAGIGLLESVSRGLSGLTRRDHSSKLQTAFRNALSSTRDTIFTRLRPGWLPADAEAQLFAGWDDIYREIRRKRRDAGVSALAPADTTELHKQNVIVALRREHDSRHVLADSAASPVTAAPPTSLAS